MTGPAGTTPSVRSHSMGLLVHLGALLLILVAESPPNAAPNVALAYIDPGTGSALVYIVTSIVVSAFYTGRGLYYKATDLFFRSGRRRDQCHLAIHCEDPRYEITFLPVVRELARRGVDQTFFTMYERDDDFEPLPLGVTHKAIPSGMVGYARLNQLEAKVLVTTTPQLDVMTFRRSKRVEHYSHIPHALGESRYVRPFAYDYFDSVFCCGETLRQNIRRMESIRNSPQKQLFATGIPHYDELLREATTANGHRNERPTVLIAPSWGPLSIFQAFGTSFVETLAESYNVIVRPHPQMKVSQAELYSEILALEGVSVNTDVTPAGAMSMADVLVSDISGIMHEFAFIHEKPVIIIDHKVGIGGLEGHLLGGESHLKEHCTDFILPLPPSEIDSLADWIDKVTGEHSAESIVEARNELVYNFGNSGCATAEQLEQLLQCL